MKSEFKPWQFEGDREVQRRKWREIYFKNRTRRQASQKKWRNSHREYIAAKRKIYQAAHRQHLNWIQRLYWHRSRQTKNIHPDLNFKFY